jgi:hypothetical protein
MQIKDLPELTTLTDSDVFLIQSEGITKKVKASTLKTYLGTEVVTPPPVVSNLKLDCLFTTNLIDLKGNILTANSGVSIIDSALKMANASAQLYVTPNTLSDFNFTGDFSISFDFKIAAYQSYQILAESTASGNNGWTFYLESDSTVSFISGASGWDNLLLHKVWFPDLNAWYHGEVKRVGSTLSMLKDGVVVREGTFTGAIAGTSNNISINNRINGAYPLNGGFKNLKITKG